MFGWYETVEQRRNNFFVMGDPFGRHHGSKVEITRGMHLGAWACQDEKSVFLVARLNVISWSRDLLKVGDAIAARMSATIC